MRYLITKNLPHSVERQSGPEILPRPVPRGTRFGGGSLLRLPRLAGLNFPKGTLCNRAGRACSDPILKALGAVCERFNELRFFWGDYFRHELEVKKEMLAGKRAVRVGDQILREIALILMERVKDPRVEGVTMTGIRLSADLRNARVYYSVMGEGSNVERAQAGLDSAKGFIKREIGLRLTLRYVPELTFLYDSTLVDASHMERLLEKLRCDGSAELNE